MYLYRITESQQFYINSIGQNNKTENSFRQNVRWLSAKIVILGKIFSQNIYILDTGILD